MPSVSECRALLAGAGPEGLPGLIETFETDERAGVRQAVASARRRLEAFSRETQRLKGLAVVQAELHAQGYAIVAGVDEVGLGALAGPVSAGAVILPVDLLIPGLDDSKALTPQKRTELSAVIRRSATAWSVAHVENDEIDRVGIARALNHAVRQAIEGLGVGVDHVLLDGLAKEMPFTCTSIVDGDAKVGCIAAASIVAKVERDAIMVANHETYPEYGWAGNKGYRSEQHIAAMAEHGISPLHRKSYAPCAAAELPRLF